MTPATAAEAEAALLETVRALPAEGRRAVLSYAQFLQHQEEERHIEADEAEWERICSQPKKMERFMDWAGQSLAEHLPAPFDESRL